MPKLGEFQLLVAHMEPAGAGALARACEALKAKLAAEGRFEELAKLQDHLKGGKEPE